MRTTLLLLLCAAALLAQGNTTIETIDDHNGWGWQSIVMKNDIITVATMPQIGARIMQYDLGDHASIYMNPDMIGETHAPKQGTWYNYGGYKVWPAPQDKWGWPPPAQLDSGEWDGEIVDNTADSVAVYVKSPKETWSKTKNISMERRTVIYKGTSRVKVEQTIINENASSVEWSVWDVTQSNVQHGNDKDWENFWVYFPIRTEGSVFGSDGVKTSKSSSAWKGEVAPGIYGVQYKPEGKKIFADSPKGWICYVDERDGMAYAKVFQIWEGEDYPDDGACNEVWINSSSLPYLEVEVLSPIWEIAGNGGTVTFTEDWYAAQVNGPIVDVNHFGATATPLTYDAETGSVHGVFGVFYVGQAKIRFKNAAGDAIAESASWDVTPMQQLTIEESIELPAETDVAELVLMDANGMELGIVSSASAAQLAGVSENIKPVSFELLQNYPNPFNPSTTLQFKVDQTQHVELSIYDMNGRLIETLISETMQPGLYNHVWDAGANASGVYLAQLKTMSHLQTQKLMFLK